MLYRSDTGTTNLLLNIEAHLEKEWDFFLVICGVTGAGKSIFMLNLLEHWYRIIKKRAVTEKDLNKITGDIVEWCENLSKLEDYDINIYDEGLLSMDTKDHMSRIQREVKKIFNTVRSSKKLFNVILVQDWFSLTKYFREHRASSLIHVYKRGEFRLYTKQGLKYLNGFNERRNVKSMTVAYPFHVIGFPDYKGILRTPYYDYINQLKQDEIKKSMEIIRESQTTTSLNDLIYDQVKSELKIFGGTKSFDELKNELGVSKGTINNVAATIKGELFKSKFGQNSQ